MSRLTFALAVIVSHVEALAARVDRLTRPAPDIFRGHDRRTNPRACPLCDGPMHKDAPRGPRPSRANGGQIKTLPAEVLTWFRCGRCHQSLIGVPPVKLVEYGRAA